MSLDDFYFWYASSIGHNVETHNNIMSILKWAIQNDLINNNIIEFIASRQWEQLGRFKATGGSDKVKASTFDIFETA
jgi:hypothetical protein